MAHKGAIPSDDMMRNCSASHLSAVAYSWLACHQQFLPEFETLADRLYAVQFANCCAVQRQITPPRARLHLLDLVCLRFAAAAWPTILSRTSGLPPRRSCGVLLLPMRAFRRAYLCLSELILTLLSRWSTTLGTPLQCYNM